MARITLPRQVGIAVASARRARGFTQTQLAQSAGVSRQLVNRLEMGSATGIALDKLLSILDAAGCAMDVHPLDDEAAWQEPAISRVGQATQPIMDADEVYALDETLFGPRKEAPDDA